MPTLLRLLVVLIVLGGLGFAGMIALTVMVNPGEKDITIRIPARDLVAPSAPLDLNNLPAPVNVAPKASSAASSAPAPAVDTADPQSSVSGVKTVDTGNE